MRNKISLSILFFLVSFFILSSYGQCQIDPSVAPYRVKPWEVGQYVEYQIISFEEEDADNRYKISIIGDEEMNGKKYFWIQIDIWESSIIHRFNSIKKQLRRNISFKFLVLPKDTESLIRDPAHFISSGIFPEDPLEMEVRVGMGKWQDVDKSSFFEHQNIINDTAYSSTPYYKGKIDFNKLEVEQQPSDIATPAGKFPSYHFFVNTSAAEEYWDEGFDLWRSAEIPILGLVKMEFSKTNYWGKWSNRNQAFLLKHKYNFFDFLFSKRVPGRRNPDTCTVILLDYEPK